MTRLLVVAMLLAGCASSQDVRFYHPEYGVVNGENENLMRDMQQCAFNSQQTGGASPAREMGEIAHGVGEHAVGNILLGAEAVTAGYKVSKKQPACISNKGWVRLENAQ